MLEEKPIRIDGVNHLGAIDYHDGFLWAGLLHGPISVITLRGGCAQAVEEVWGSATSARATDSPCSPPPPVPRLPLPRPPLPLYIPFSSPLPVLARSPSGSGVRSPGVRFVPVIRVCRAARRMLSAR